MYPRPIAAAVALDDHHILACDNADHSHADPDGIHSAREHAGADNEHAGADHDHAIRGSDGAGKPEG